MPAPQYRRGLSAPRAPERAGVRVGRLAAVTAAVAVVAGGIAGMSLGLGARASSSTQAQITTAPPASSPPPVVPVARPVSSLPVPNVSHAAGVDGCTFVREAGGGSADVIRELGAEGIRAAIAQGSSCVDVNDPTALWVVVNKHRPISPIDFAPEVVMPASTTNVSSVNLRDDAAAALDDLTATAGAEGAGDMAVVSGYRSYNTQVATYDNHVGDLGQTLAEHLSARPGHSEHQLGLAADVVACDGSACGTLDTFGGTAQATWVAENAWRFGFIVRYNDGETEVTGYNAEPWHLRYIGHDLAAAYHDGGYRSLEAFFDLPAAPTYPGE